MPAIFEQYTLAFVSAFLLLGVFIILLSVLFSRKQVKNKSENERLHAIFQQTLLQSQLEIREQTLQYVGHELHDNLGQVASLIKLNLNTVSLSQPEKANLKIDQSKELIVQLITDLKQLSVSLGADHIAQSGIVKAIETEAERLRKTGQFEVQLTIEGCTPFIDPGKAIVLFRMYQEILNNTVKHSQATDISIAFTTTETDLLLYVQDNGTGFDAAEKERSSSGAGLRNLKQRAQTINAAFTLESTPGNGTITTIQLPL